MNILLTGATGYLGSQLLKALIENPTNRIAILVRKKSQLGRIADLLGQVECVQLEACDFQHVLEAAQIDTIIHCATNYGRRSVPRPDIVEANLLVPLKLLDAALRSGQPTVFINTDTMLDKSISTYSLSKSQFRDWLLAYSDERACVNVALEHFFGPGDDPSKFVSFIVQALLRGDSCIPLTGGEQQRDFVYIDDVVSAFLFIVHFARGLTKGFVEFEVGRGESVQVREFVQLAKALCKNQVTDLQFGALAYRPNEVMRVTANTEKLRALGWGPSFSIEQGLRRMIEREKACEGDS
jgi:CDP-paratose synthetase